MLHIKKEWRPVYALTDMLEEEYPELLKRAESYFNSFMQLQEKLLVTLPVCKEQLNNDFMQLSSSQNQVNIQKFITQYALFTFAMRACDELQRLCTKLAEAINKNERNQQTPI